MVLKTIAWLGGLSVLLFIIGSCASSGTKDDRYYLREACGRMKAEAITVGEKVRARDFCDSVGKK